MIKMLIISSECWRDDSNGGNVLSNLFAGMDDIEFAQIYCKGGLPQNRICKKYFRMNDGMAMKAILKHKDSLGEVLDYKDYPENLTADLGKSGFYDFFRTHDWPIFFAVRDLLWKLAPYKNNKLKKFIIQFNPDLIFAPCYASLTMLSLDRWVKTIVDVPMISYISDDNYSLKQVRLDPVYWVHRFLIRKSIRKTAKSYSYMYTMTEQQAGELSDELKLRMPILRKGVNIAETAKRENDFSTSQLRFIYGGGTYLGRDEILYKIVKALQELKKEEGIDFKLDIFTQSSIPEKYMKVLNSDCSEVHKPITAQELRQKYLDSHIALHVESFIKKYAYQTRLSFSTKIVDCLGSGCVTVAVCPSINAGWQYLKANNAAYCIDRIDNIKNELKKLICDRKLMNEIRQNAYKCLIENHDINIIKENLHKDLCSMVQQRQGESNEDYSN